MPMIEREREALIAEVRLHLSDDMDGSPLDLGGITIACHAGNCPRCAYLAREAALNSLVTTLDGAKGGGKLAKQRADAYRKGLQGLQGSGSTSEPIK